MNLDYPHCRRPISNRSDASAYGCRRMHAPLRDRDWNMKHIKIKRLMQGQAMHLPRQRHLVATSDSDHDESLFLKRSRKHEVNVPNQLWVVVLT